MEREGNEAPPLLQRYAPGTVFQGKYCIERVVGAGGMGTVLAAKHLALDERVAIKVVLPELAKNPEVVERFLREGRASVKIRSEHVARVMDVSSAEDGTPYMVMEYLEGSDLSHVLESRGRLPLEEAVGFVLQACEALAQAHALGIVHRDLKPANLFLTTSADGQPCVKVLDFGISKVGPGSTVSSDHGLTKTNAMMGTPAYMAPEQMRSTRAVDTRADVWAMGVILYELLSGKPPFGGTTMADLIVSILQDKHPPLAGMLPAVPSAVDAIVSRCLEKDPDQRFPSVAELASALEAFGPPGANVSVMRIGRTLAGVPRAPSSADLVPDVSAKGNAPPGTAGAWATATSSGRKRATPVVVSAAVGSVLALAIGAIWLGTRATTPAVAEKGGTTAIAPPSSPSPHSPETPPPSATLAPMDIAPLAPSGSPSSKGSDSTTPAPPESSARTPDARPKRKTPPAAKKTTVDDRHG